MSAADTHQPGAPQPKQDPEQLVLRGRPRPAIRFRRGLIIAIAGAVCAALVGLAWIALEPPSFKSASGIDDGAERGRVSHDAVAGAPASYADVPRLGPPLPGDLGRAMLDHQAGAGGGDAGGEASAIAGRRDLEPERRASRLEAARTSDVLVNLGAGPSGAPPLSGERTAGPATSEAAKASLPTGASAPANGDIDAGAAEPARTVAESGADADARETLSAGTIIPASLITGLNSDLPGIVIAQVTANVRDSADGRTVLIPQGARLIGRYDRSVAFGETRALLIWERLVFPNGASLKLDAMPASDSSGYSGLADRVNAHEWRLVKGVALATILGIGTELGLGSSESDLVRAVRESAQQNAAHAGDQITSRNLDVRPTLIVRPGWPVLAILQSDLLLSPWKG